MIFFNILLRMKSMSSKKEFTRDAEVGLSAFQADPPLLVHFATSSLLQLGQSEKKGDEHLFPSSWQSHLLAEQLAPFYHRTATFLFLLLSPLSSFSVTIFTMTHLAGDQTSLRVFFSHQKHRISPALKSCLKRMLVGKLRNCCKQ